MEITERVGDLFELAFAIWSSVNATKITCVYTDLTYCESIITPSWPPPCIVQSHGFLQAPFIAPVQARIS